MSATIHHVPFKRNKNFTGRRAQMEKLSQLVFTERRERVAIVGPAGIGKTQIALELAHQAQASLNECSILWMAAHSLPAFEGAVIKLVQRLSIPCSRGEDPKKALMTYLSSEAAGHWLLILDGADDMTLSGGVPGTAVGLLSIVPTSSTGQVLITTRSSTVAVSLAGSCTLYLANMTTPEACDLLAATLEDKSQLSEIGGVVVKLVEKLAHLPTAMMLAAAWMNAEKQSITAYLRAFDGVAHNQVDFLSTQLREIQNSEIRIAMATAWILSYDAVCKATDESWPARILSDLRFFEPDAIPLDMLDISGVAYDVYDPVTRLCRYSILDGRDDKIKVTDMHRLVHQCLKAWPHEEQHRLNVCKKQVMGRLNFLFNRRDDPYILETAEERYVRMRYLPHALQLIQSTELELSYESRSLALTVAHFLTRRGRAVETIALMRSVLSIQNKTLAEDDDDRLESEHALADAYRANGQVERAVDVLERIVALRERILDEDNDDRLFLEEELGRAYLAHGQVDKAVRLLERAVSIQRLERNPCVLDAQHDLARAYMANNQIKHAVELLEKTVATWELMRDEDQHLGWARQEDDARHLALQSDLDFARLLRSQAMLSLNFHRD